MDLFEHLRPLSDNGGGVVSVIATCCIVGWRIYRLPVLQERIPAKVRWCNLSPVMQWTITVGGSALGGVLTALSTGKTGWELVIAALRAIKDVLLS